MKDESLSVQCPFCGSRVGQKCELSTGYPRTTPHQERCLNAADKEKAKQ